MNLRDTYDWIFERRDLQAVLLQIDQPLTATQLSIRCRLRFPQVVRILELLHRKRLVVCVNLRATQNRLYFPSDAGKDCQRLLAAEDKATPPNHYYPDIDWDLYAWVCFRHRGPILGSLNKPLRPAQIKKWLRDRYPRMRISADNIWDALQLMLKKGVVRAVSVVGSRFMFYELTKTGRQLQTLLKRAYHGFSLSPAR